MAARQVSATRVPLTARAIAMTPSRPSMAARLATSWKFGRPTVWPASTRLMRASTASSTRTVALSAPGRGAKSFYGRGTGYQPLPAGQHPAVHGRHPIRHRRRDGQRRAQRDAQRFFVQDGPTTQQQTFGGFNSLLDGFCYFYGQSNGQGGVSYGISQGISRGMLLPMPMWGSPNYPNSVTWMDNGPNGPCPVILPEPQSMHHFRQHQDWTICFHRLILLPSLQTSTI
jgi:hypothetical protein